MTPGPEYRGPGGGDVVAARPGLVPVIAQDAGDGAVLMLAWADAAALRRTLATGQAWYYSRSRARHWRKGATSGHTQSLVGAYRDCDRDAVLYQVEQVGPACHTGERSCFYRPLGPADVGELEFAATPGAGLGQGFLADLDKIIADRAERPPEGSYVASLLAHSDANRVFQKVGEEGVEFALAAATAGDSEAERERLLDEAADLVFHLLIALRAKGLSLADVEAQLRGRHTAR